MNRKILILRKEIVCLGIYFAVVDNKFKNMWSMKCIEKLMRLETICSFKSKSFCMFYTVNIRILYIHKSTKYFMILFSNEYANFSNAWALEYSYCLRNVLCYDWRTYAIEKKFSVGFYKTFKKKSKKTIFF